MSLDIGGYTSGSSTWKLWMRLKAGFHEVTGNVMRTGNTGIGVQNIALWIVMTIIITMDQK